MAASAARESEADPLVLVRNPGTVLLGDLGVSAVRVL
jgi:hypothetical protein